MNNKPPKNWNRVSLGEILDYERPDKYIVSSEDYNDNYKTPVLTAGKTFILGYTDENDGIYENIPVIIFDDFTTESKYVDFNFKVKSSAMKILKAKNNTTLKYLYYLMQTIPFNHETHKRYWISEYSKLKIDIPEKIEEQQEIVQVLDTMSDIIRLREECISHAQDLIPAIFQEMFGDANNNITKSTIVRFRDCIDLNPSKPNLDDNLNVTFLGMKDISEKGQVDLSTTKTYEEVKKGFTNFENEDVLLAKITPCFENGKAAIVRNLLNGYGFGSTEFYVLRPHQNIILPEYVYAIIKSYTFAEPGKYKMTGAAGQKRLPKDYILNYKFPLPPLEAQEQFAEKVREINSYIEEQQEELENAKQMFQSLLHHAFTGELTKHKYGE